MNSFDEKIEKIIADSKLFGVPTIREESRKVLMQKVREKNPKNILEIGTAVGVSGISMLYSADADCKLTTIEHNQDFIKQAKANFKLMGFSHKVKIIEGDCLATLAKMTLSAKYAGHFDFIFLDGPKAQYGTMLDMLLILLAPGGQLIADDVLFHSYVESNDSNTSKRFKTIIKRLEEFIKKCKNSPFLMNFELKTLEDGLIFAEKVQNEKSKN